MDFPNKLCANPSVSTACACLSVGYALNGAERLSVREFGLTDFRPCRVRASNFAKTTPDKSIWRGIIDE